MIAVVVVVVVIVMRRKELPPLDLDDLITRLVAVRNLKFAKPVPMQESELKMLCAVAREVFLKQPMLLELAAPLKIAG